MVQAVLSDSQRFAIEEELRACLAGCDAAADNVDADRTFSYWSDMHELGFIYNGTMIPSLDAVVVSGRKMFGQMQSQTHETSELRIAVLAPNVAIMTWHGIVTSTGKDGSTDEGVFARTYVCAKVEDEWKFIHVHISILPQA